MQKGYYPTGIYPPNIVLFTAPHAALVKALVIHSAQPLSVYDMDGAGTYATPNLPSGQQGFGRIQLDQVLLLDSITTFGNLFLVDVALPPNNAGGLTTGGADRICLNVTSGARFIKATLVWTDPPSSPTSGLILVNNLDLVIIDSTGKEWKTNTVSDGGLDAVNNVEQVMISNPAPGYYGLIVHALHAPTLQSYALAVTGDFEIEICSSAFPVCPLSCSGKGTCGTNGYCTCESGRQGVDCSLTPCPSDCSGNGVCDFVTKTCNCGLNFGGASCSTVVSSGDTTSNNVVVVKSNSSVSVGEIVGFAFLGFFVGAILCLVIGGFGAVKYLTYKRDKTAKEAEESPN